jgi:uncharacterized DUF497 family protein
MKYHVAPFIEQKQRYHLIGLCAGLILLVVVFVERSEAGEEVIRIISVRKALKYEEKLYEGQFRD